MKINQTVVWTLQLSNILMKEYDYIPVRTNDPETNEELWMVNPDAPVFPVVRITPFNANADKYDLDRILVVYQAILNRTKNTGKLLSVHISNEAPQEIDQNIVEFCMDIDYMSSDVLEKNFPKLVGVLKPMENPEEEYRRIIEELKATNSTPKARKQARHHLKFKTSDAIGLVCVAITILSGFLIAHNGSEVVTSILCGALYKTLIYGNHEWWRLFTYAFVHTSWLHLFFNLYALGNTASFVEKAYGRTKMLICLFVSIITSALFVLATKENGVTIGLSGGIFGLFGMLGVYLFETGAIHNKQILSSVVNTICINALISFMPNISLMGHLGGLIGGVMVGLIVSNKKDWKQLRTHTMIASVILIAALGYRIANDERKTPIYGGTDAQYVEAIKELGFEKLSEKISVNLIKYYIKVGE